MKRIFAILCIVVVTGLLYAAPYTVVTELFKSLDCEYCPHVLEVYEEMYDAGLNIIPVVFDMGFSGYNDRRGGTYSSIVGGVPIAVFGGATSKVGYNLANPNEPQLYYGFYEDLITYESPLTIDSEFTFNNQGLINIASTVEVVGEISGTNLLAHTFLTIESGPGSTIIHTDATRFKVIHWVNQPFTIQAGVTTYNIIEQIPLQAGWPIDQLRAVVVIQESAAAEPKKIYQATMVAFEGTYALQVIADILSGAPNLTVNFADNSYLPGLEVTSYAWDLNGDGITDSTSETPSYTYTTPGLYSVTLSVTVAGQAEPLTNTFTNMIYCKNPNNVSDVASGEWVAEHSPYIITGAVSVPRGRSLIIQEGVTIKVADSVTITVSGNFSILGTAENPVLITAQSEDGTWSGLRMESTATEVSEIHHATFEKSSTTALVATRRTNISNCIFRYNGASNYSGTAAITFNGGANGSPSTLKNSIISNNQASGSSACAGVGIPTSGTVVHISNCLFVNNTANYVAGVRVASSGIVNITNSTFYNNRLTSTNNSLIGDISVNSSTAITRNSIVQRGFYATTTNTTNTVSYSITTNSVTGTGNITGNPLFANLPVNAGATYDSDGETLWVQTSPQDWLLTADSPCIDAGDPATAYNDLPDPVNPTLALAPSLGTIRNDMGAYGGPEPFPMPPYNPPRNLIATPNPNSVTLSWAAPNENMHTPSFAGYKVYESNTSLTPTAINTTTFTHQELSIGAYTYTVSAVYTAGESIPTQPVTINIYNIQPPLNLQATNPTQGTISLTWQPPSSTVGLTHYDVYRRAGSTGDFDLVETITENTSYTDEEMDYGTYSYYVTAVFANGLFASSATETIMLYTPPTNLVATPSLNSVTLNWSAPEESTQTPDLVGYNVYEDNTPVNTAPINATTFTHQNLTVGTYTYTVSAVYAGGESLPTEPVSTTIYDIQPPTDLQATNPVQQTVSLTWQAPSSIAGLLHYKVYRKLEEDEAYTPLPAIIESTTFNDIGMDNGTYNYYVTAVFANGESTPSNIETLTLFTIFISVNNLTATIGFNVVDINWIAPTTGPATATLSGYRLLKGETVIDENMPITTTTYHDNTVLNGQAYTYTVVALYTDPDGESIGITVNAQMKVFNPVSSVNPEPLFNRLVLSWGTPAPDPNSATLSGYRIERDNAVLVENLSDGSASYQDDTANNGQAYTYTVIALYTDPTGEATPVSANAQMKVFNAPTNLQATSTEQVVLNWVAPDTHEHQATLAGYYIYRDGTVHQTITNPSQLSFTDTNVVIDITYNYFVSAIYTNPVGESTPTNTVTGHPVSDYDEVLLPTITQLDGNYPNPFNPETIIRFAVAKDDNVVINVYNVSGQLVRSLVNGSYKVGNHQAVWNGRDNSGRPVSSGIYFYRMNTSEYVAVKKMLLLK